MKQLFQNLGSGMTELIECPVPQCTRGSVLIQTRASLVSLGTERMLVEFGKSNLVQKAMQQPEKVRQVLDKMKTDGLLQTVHAVTERLDEPLPLGYCNAGIVKEVGEGVTDCAIGDHVVSNGPHAEIVVVPRNLVAKIPEGVSFEHAAFTVAGSIGLQGVRLALPTLGETVVVIGLGLIGQLTAQLAKIHGCRVIAFDLDKEKVFLADSLGIEAVVTENPIPVVLEKTSSVGADCVIISASSSSEAIISQAATMCRKRGRIILVGVVPLNIKRADFYEKELSFQVSCSYGPGRYDPEYEKRGHDYPLPFVRWTEQRNFDAVLQCIAHGSLQLEPLITERVPLDATPTVYAALGTSKAIATVITYPVDDAGGHSRLITVNPASAVIAGNASCAIIGAGNFTKMTLLPALRRIGASTKYICSQTGTTAPHLARKFGIPFCTTDIEQVLDDAEVTSVIITTRHKSHTGLCLKALAKKKHVFVEKPLAVNRQQLEQLTAFFIEHEAAGSLLTVGFNRRYSPLSECIKKSIGIPSRPISMIFTMNAGAIPATHWLQSTDEGGRIIGEACHCIDLFCYFAGSPVVAVCASSTGCDTNTLADTVSIMVKCKNGSMGTIHYFANGNKRYSKEILSVFYDGIVMTIDNFRSLQFFGGKGKKRQLMGSDKGHVAQFRAYFDYLQGKSVVKNSLKEYLNVTEATIAAVESLEKKTWITVDTIW